MEKLKHFSSTVGRSRSRLGHLVRTKSKYTLVTRCRYLTAFEHRLEHMKGSPSAKVGATHERYVLSYLGKAPWFGIVVEEIRELGAESYRPEMLCSKGARFAYGHKFHQTE